VHRGRAEQNVTVGKRTINALGAPATGANQTRQTVSGGIHIVADSEQIVREFLDSFLAGDIEKVLSVVDEDVEWNFAEHHPFLGAQYKGRDALADVIVPAIMTTLDGFRFDIERVLGSVDAAVSQLRYRGAVKSTGQTLDLPAVLVWDLRDGKVCREQEYVDTWQFRAAFGHDANASTLDES
jgi:ketosteroid isomerase-like protein